MPSPRVFTSQRAETLSVLWPSDLNAVRVHVTPFLSQNMVLTDFNALHNLGSLFLRCLPHPHLFRVIPLSLRQG